MRGLLLFFLALMAFAAGALIFGQNDSPVQLSFFGQQFEVTLNLLMIGCFLGGFLLGMAFLLPGFASARIQLSSIRKKAKVNEDELKNLRALPLRDDF